MGNNTSLTQMNELERQEALEEYLREFNFNTNHGRIFAVDTSTLDTEDDSVRATLTNEETKERLEWVKTRCDLQSHYLVSSSLKDLTVKELLQLRIAPPLLVLDLSDSSRSDPDTECERLYPDTVYAWVDFETEVQSFAEPVVEKGRKVDHVLYHSLHSGMDLCDEIGERTFFLNYVLEPLQKAQVGWNTELKVKQSR